MTEIGPVVVGLIAIAFAYLCGRNDGKRTVVAPDKPARVIVRASWGETMTITSPATMTVTTTSARR